MQYIENEKSELDYIIILILIMFWIIPVYEYLMKV
jgi:hypothetical protein